MRQIVAPQAFSHRQQTACIRQRLCLLQCTVSGFNLYCYVLFRIVPGQLVRGKLNELQTRDMIKVAAMRPMDRTRFIEDQVRPIIRDSTSQAFGVHVSSDMVEVRIYFCINAHSISTFIRISADSFLCHEPNRCSSTLPGLINPMQHWQRPSLTRWPTM